MGKQDKQKIRRYRIGKKNPLLELRYRELKILFFANLCSKVRVVLDGIKYL